MYNKDTLNVSIIKNAPDVVEYKFENESVINIVNKKEIYKIIFSSGRTEVPNQKKLAVINSKKDWEKVLITFDENDVAGMTECGKVVGSSATGIAGAAMSTGEGAMRQMKKKAAEIGAPIILIVDGWNKEKGRPTAGIAGVMLTGIAYKNAETATP
jgi:hypothetical protein